MLYQWYHYSHINLSYNTTERRASHTSWAPISSPCRQSSLPFFYFGSISEYNLHRNKSSLGSIPVKCDLSWRFLRIQVKFGHNGSKCQWKWDRIPSVIAPIWSVTSFLGFSKLRKWVVTRHQHKSALCLFQASLSITLQEMFQGVLFLIYWCL